MFKPRNYRQWIRNDDLVFFEVVEKETDLGISASRNLEAQAREAILNYRADIERYCRRQPEFLSALEPVALLDGAPPIVQAMAEAAEKAYVGPMAAVAGAVAEFVGRELMAFSPDVIVENGGDIFLRTGSTRTLGVFAGERSPFTGSLAVVIPVSAEGLGVCTSSGTVSHSLSFGRSDATLIMAGSASLADAVATAAGNLVQGPDDIRRAIDLARSIDGVRGVLITVGEALGTWGEIVLA